MDSASNSDKPASIDEGRGDLAARVLPQRHASLMARATLSRALARGCNLLAFLLLVERPPSSWTALAAWLLLACMLAVVWLSDRRSAGQEVHMIERALAKRNDYEYAQVYIAWRFEVSSAMGSVVLRYEPHLWLLLNVGAAIAFVAPGRLGA